MRGPRRLPAALVAALIAVVGIALAGCGNAATDRANAYVKQVNEAQSSFAQTVRRLNGRVTDTSTPRQDRSTLRSFTRAVDGVVKDLRRIDAPDSVRRLHRRLVDDMDAYARQVRSVASSVRSNDARRLIDSQQRLLKATSTVSRQINSTITAINRRLHA
jgi:hypothetical protein